MNVLYGLWQESSPGHCILVPAAGSVHKSCWRLSQILHPKALKKMFSSMPRNPQEVNQFRRRGLFYNFRVHEHPVIPNPRKMSAHENVRLQGILLVLHGNGTFQDTDALNKLDSIKGQLDSTIGQGS